MDNGWIEVMFAYSNLGKNVASSMSKQRIQSGNQKKVENEKHAKNYADTLERQSGEFKPV